MIKSDLVDLVIQLSPDNNYNRGLISRVLGLALGDIYFAVFKQEPSFINDYLHRYHVTSVRHDANISICTLPTSVMQFPVIGDCTRVYSQSEPDLVFAPIRMDENSLLGDINEIDDVIGFEVKGQEVWLWGMTKQRDLIIEAIPSFETMSDTDEFKVPAGQQANLIQTAKEILGVAPPRAILSYRTPTQ